MKNITDKEITVFEIIKRTDKQIMVLKKKRKQESNEIKGETNQNSIKLKIKETKKIKYTEIAEEELPLFFISNKFIENLPDISSIFTEKGGKIYLAKTEKGVSQLIENVLLKGKKLKDLDSNDQIVISIDTEWDPFSKDKMIDVIQLSNGVDVCIFQLNIARNNKNTKKDEKKKNTDKISEKSPKNIPIQTKSLLFDDLEQLFSSDHVQFITWDKGENGMLKKYFQVSLKKFSAICDFDIHKRFLPRGLKAVTSILMGKKNVFFFFFSFYNF